MKKTLLILVSLTLSNFLFADSSRDLAAKGKLAFEAFYCSNLAFIAGDIDESRRLLIVGFKSGKEFFEARENNRIKTSDLKDIVPMQMAFDIHGIDAPTIDFKLGVIYRDIKEIAIQHVFEEPLWKYELEERQELAKAELIQRNASLLK